MSTLRARWTVLGSCALLVIATLDSPTAGATPATVTGSGSVFKVNPVQSSGNENLVDDNDSATAVPAGEYATVALRNLDGSGYLSGTWVNVRSSIGPLAAQATYHTALARDGAQAAQLVRNAFAARGITF